MSQYQKIKTANIPLYEEKRTYLSQDAASGTTSIEVLSTIGFTITGTTDYYILIEQYGDEKAELLLVDANDETYTNATGFKVSALKFAHSASAPVTYIPYNQIKIYGRTTSGGANNYIATVDIDCSENYTEYVYKAEDYSYFVTTYYNSTTFEESAESDEIENGDFGHNSVKRIIKSGLRKAITKIDENQTGELSWDTAMEVVEDGIDEIITRKRKWSFLHKVDSTTYDTVAGQSYVSLPTDCLIVQNVKIAGSKLKWISEYDYNKMIDGTTQQQGTPYCYTIKNNRVELYPVPSAAADVTYEYFYNPARITNLITEIPQPFVVLLTYYCGSQFSAIRGNQKKADTLYSKFLTILEQQVEEYTGQIQDGDAQYAEFTSYENDLELPVPLISA